MYMILRKIDKGPPEFGVLSLRSEGDYYMVITEDRMRVIEALKVGEVVYNMDEGMRRVKKMTVDYHEELE